VTVHREGLRPSASAAAIAIGIVVLAAGSHARPEVTLAPLLVLLWWLAASGLGDTIAAMSKGSFGIAAAAALLVLFPVLQGTHRAMDERDDRMAARGHHEASLRHVRRMLNVVVPGASLVEEDASVDVLLRAAVLGGSQGGKRFTLIARRADVASRAASAGPVYAFPQGQEELSLRGFAAEPVSTALTRSDGRREVIEGLATVAPLRPCQRISNTWVDIGSAAAGGRLAVVADEESVRGPVTMYLGGSTAASPQPDRWPPRTTRGLLFSLYDQRDPKRAARLQAAGRNEGLSGSPVMAAPFVAEITIFRTPRSPLALPVRLGASFPVGVARLERPGGEAGRLMACDAPDVAIASFGSRID
jgi:hypothetical protein